MITRLITRENNSESNFAEGKYLRIRIDFLHKVSFPPFSVRVTEGNVKETKTSLRHKNLPSKYVSMENVYVCWMHSST